MLSSILLDDGPLTVHDFERLGRAPYRLILAGCDSGVAAPVGADELLGLVSSLGPLGAAGIVASILPVNDRAVVPLMLALPDAQRLFGVADEVDAVRCVLDGSRPAAEVIAALTPELPRSVVIRQPPRRSRLSESTQDTLDYFNHYALLGGIENLFGLPRLGYAKSPSLLVWSSSVFNAGL